MSADGSSGPMTLLLTVSAVRRLEDPGPAVSAARGWSEHVGVVGDATEPVDDVRRFVDGLDADPDLVAGQVSGSLADIRQRLRTDRHVLVGTTDRQAEIAAALGWEFEHVEAAADAAEWPLTPPERSADDAEATTETADGDTGSAVDSPSGDADAGSEP